MGAFPRANDFPQRRPIPLSDQDMDMVRHDAPRDEFIAFPNAPHGLWLLITKPRATAAAAKSSESESCRDQCKCRWLWHYGKFTRHTLMPRHRAGIPIVSVYARSPCDEVTCWPWVSCKIRNRRKRSVVDISGDDCGSVKCPIRTAHKGGCSVVHNDKRMRAGGPLESVGLPGGQD